MHPLFLYLPWLNFLYMWLSFPACWDALSALHLLGKILLLLALFFCRIFLPLSSAHLSFLYFLSARFSRRASAFILSSCEHWTHGILPKRVYGFTSAPSGYFFRNPALFDFFSIRDGDSLCSSCCYGVCPYAIMVAGTSHAVRFSDFKFFHFVFSLLFGFCPLFDSIIWLYVILSIEKLEFSDILFYIKHNFHFRRVKCKAQL